MIGIAPVWQMPMMLAMSEEALDLIIVGAGISGIGMATHYKTRLPGKRFAILERRERLGGTWDLFRYPGIRSDSDMYTLGFAFAPWREKESIAPGETILNYLDRVVDEHGLRKHIRPSSHVVSADWSAEAGLWTLALADGAPLQTRFLFLGSGYYDYDRPHEAEIPGLGGFGGTTIHPQFWPEDFDPAGKRIVVIGSGATAVTLVPALAEQGAQVTMLQRTPTWMASRPSEDKLANALRKLLPERWAYALTRFKNIALHSFLFNRARNRPEEVGAFLQEQTREALGDRYREEHFTPPYGPWEQRLCLVPDGDIFEAIKAGKAEIVTGAIRTVDAAGIALDDGSRIDADAIVTATGLRVAIGGKIAVSLDGRPVNFADRFYYRDCMFSNVPNFAALFGYLNAGWTLRVDIVADWLCRLLGQMEAWRMDVAMPVLPADHGLIEEHVTDYFSSGYLQRARDIIPKSSTTAPWRISMDYHSDKRELRDAPIDDGVMRFGRVTGLQSD
jgi:cation diffusion facilitator CzcD-associated flavoprotein CzcO